MLYRAIMGSNEPSARAKNIMREVQLKQLRNALLLYKTSNLYDLYKQGEPLFRFIFPLTKCPAVNNKISQSDFEKICNYYIVCQDDNSWILYEKKSDYTKKLSPVYQFSRRNFHNGRGQTLAFQSGSNRGRPIGVRPIGVQSGSDPAFGCFLNLKHSSKPPIKLA